MEKNVQKIRQSNFELMRMISMIFVVMWHLILHSGLYEVSGDIKFFLEFLILIGVVHINSFVLITGYFQYDKKFSWNKFFKNFFLVWFYKVLFSSIFYGFHYGSISKIEFLQELLPLDFRDYWYMNCYLLLYLITPWLNHLIKVMSQKEHRKLLLICFVLFSLIPLITKQTTVANNGYTIIQFVYMYFIGAYLKKYPMDNNYHFIHYSKNKRQFIYFSISIFCLFLNFLVLQFAHSLELMDSAILRDIGSYFIHNNRLYSNPIVIIQSIFYFLYFSTLSIKSKKINFFSKAVLDVYLIHENYYIASYFYKFFKIDAWLSFSIYGFIISIIGLSLVVFLCCLLLGLVRYYLFHFIGKCPLIIKLRHKVVDYVNHF